MVIIRVLAAVGLVAALVMASRLSPAEACSHPDGGPFPYVVEPEDRAAEVPTAVELTVLEDSGCSESVFGCGMIESPVLLDDNDVPVPLTTRVTETFGQNYGRGYLLLAKPEQPLQPAAHYRVQVTAPFGEPTVIREFDTAADTGAERTPAAPELRLTSATPIECSESSSPITCCSTYPSLALVSLELEVRGDTRPDDLYEIRMESPAGSTLLRAGVTAPIRGLVACSNLPETDTRGIDSRPFVVLGGERTLSVVARSITGQSSPPTLLQLDDHCAAGSAVDGGAATDVAGSPATATVVAHGGCAALPARVGSGTWSASSRSDLLLLALGLVMTAIILRSRRSRAR
jgi:hypothetical protein